MRFLLVLLTVLFSAASFGASPVKVAVKPFLVKGDKLLPLPEQVPIGSVVEFDLLVKNLSNSTLKEVKVRAKLPEKAELLNGTLYGPNPQLQSLNGTSSVVWTVPELPPEKVEVLRFRVKVK